MPPGFGLINDGFKKDNKLKAKSDGLVYDGGVVHEDSQESFLTHPQLERQISQFLCSEKVVLHFIFTSSSSWNQPCNCWNDSNAKNRGKPLLGV